MKNFWNNLRKNRSALQLIMVMFLMYPTFFSFSHALNHHLIPQSKKHHSCCEQIYDDNTSSHLKSNSKATKCPIHEYEFPLAIEPALTQPEKKPLEFAKYIFPYSSKFISKELDQQISPRAPPVSA